MVLLTLWNQILRIIPEIFHGHLRVLSPIIPVHAHYARNSPKKHAGLRGNVSIIFLKFKIKFIKTIIEDCQYKI